MRELRKFTLAECGSRPIAITTGIDSESAQWHWIAKQRLEELLQLRAGWDGYSGSPVFPMNAVFAYHVLSAVCSADTPAPDIVPGQSGDLQIEWHSPRGDIELWIRGPNNVHAWRSTNEESVEEMEIDLTTDFSVITRWVSNLNVTKSTDVAGEDEPSK